MLVLNLRYPIADTKQLAPGNYISTIRGERAVGHTSQTRTAEIYRTARIESTHRPLAHLPLLAHRLQIISILRDLLLCGVQLISRYGVTASRGHPTVSQIGQHHAVRAIQCDLVHAIATGRG
ncbi:hypothetical protein A7X68_16815 [Stenotrophomonas maltophilia]|nr:hypothetical protein A7X68_16815 [Stenotrophomonas maltophilia]